MEKYSSEWVDEIIDADANMTKEQFNELKNDKQAIEAFKRSGLREVILFNGGLYDYEYFIEAIEELDFRSLKKLITGTSMGELFGSDIIVLDERMWG